MKSFIQYISEAKRSPFRDRVDKLASDMKIKKEKGKNYAPEEPADIYTHDKKIAGHNVNMVAQHMPGKNRSRIDFKVDGDAGESPDTTRTGKVGAKKARKILTHATAFAKRHNKNMGGGDHETEFTSMKASAHHKNPEARTKIYRKLVKRMGARGTGELEVDPKSNPMSPTVRRKSEYKKGPTTTFRVKLEHIEEGASVGPGSPWAKANKGRINPPPTAVAKKKKVKPSSVYDVGHYSDSDSMKKSELFHIGSKTGHASITHHDHHKESNKRRRKAGWEGKVTPNNANHGTWKKTKQDPTEHFAQGRIDHIKKKYTVNGSNETMEIKARNRLAKTHPNYKEHVYESFTEYITEAKNLHMTHVEDLVFEGSARTAEAISFIEEIAKMLDGNSKSRTNATVKWDGAPAIFCGKNPENGKFFVGSKSIFNKTPKINYTISDIRKNHQGGVADKLATALKHLKKLPISGILQGDMMFGPGDVGTKNIDGVSHYVFTPNTITYAVPVDSGMGKKIKRAKMGIVFHTTYKGRKMDKLSASFGANVNRLKRNSAVWVDDADFKDVSGTATLTKSESNSLSSILSTAKGQFKSISSFLDEISSNKKVIDNVNIYANSKVRQGSTTLSSKEFITFMNDKIQKEIDSLKSEEAIKRRESTRDEMVKYLNAKNKELDSVFSLHASLTEAKILLVRKLESVKSIGTFIQTDDGFKVTAPEGFVGIDKYTSNAVKLVDRLEFSKANFTVPKKWA